MLPVCTLPVACMSAAQASPPTSPEPLPPFTTPPLLPPDPELNAAAAMCDIVNSRPATPLGAVEGMALATIAANWEVRWEWSALLHYMGRCLVKPG